MIKELVLNYKMLIENLGQMIDISGYRNDFLAKKLGLKPTTFSVKKKRASWTNDEVERLLSIIENEETEDYYLGLIMSNIDKTETISLAEFKEEVGWN